MAIINVNDVDFAYLNTRAWDDDTYWYVDALSLFTEKLFVPSEAIAQNATLIVCMAFEPHIEIVDRIYEDLVIENNIDPQKILLISENVDLVDYIKHVANKHQRKLIRYECGVGYQFTTRLHIIKNYKRHSTIEPKSIPSDKIFLNFNRRWRLHRPLIIALLMSNNLLTKGHISFGACEKNDTWESVYPSLLEIVSADIEFTSVLERHKTDLFSLPNMYLDTDTLKPDRLKLQYDDIVPEATDILYKETAFSLVSETLFFNNIGRFLSEKIYKPIAYHHPFILVGQPFTLSLLREMGYKTFSPYIDESYDNETDNIKRLKMIVSEVKRLCELSNDELAEFIRDTRPITEHNFLHLISTNHKTYKKL